MLPINHVGKRCCRQCVGGNDVRLQDRIEFCGSRLGGGFLQGWLGTFWETMPHPNFFLMIAAIGLLSAFIVWIMERPLRPYLQKSHG